MSSSVYTCVSDRPAQLPGRRVVPRAMMAASLLTEGKFIFSDESTNWVHFSRCLSVGGCLTCFVFWFNWSFIFLEPRQKDWKGNVGELHCFHIRIKQKFFVFFCKRVFLHHHKYTFYPQVTFIFNYFVQWTQVKLPNLNVLSTNSVPLYVFGDKIVLNCIIVTFGQNQVHFVAFC